MNNYTFLILIYFSVFLQLIGLAFAIIIDPYMNSKHRVVIFVNCFLTTILIIQNYLDYYFSLFESTYFARLITGIIGYSIRPIIIVMWLYLIRKKQKLIFSWALAIINVLIHLTALFTNVCFTITKENHFQRGPLGYSCHVISAILLLYLLWLSTDMYTDLLDKKMIVSGGASESGTAKGASEQIKQDFRKYKYGLESLIPSWCVFVIVISVVLDSKILLTEAPIVFLTVAIVNSNLFYYIWIHLALVLEHQSKQSLKTD